jgi:caffeoyl-CoA O-methyltransferase
MKLVTVAGIDEYATRSTSPEPQFMIDLTEQTKKDLDDPQMIVGLQGARLLQALIYSLRPNLVLEIGTFSGYSSISMAAALPPNGRVISCDINHRHVAIARRNIEASGHADRITVELGPALDTIERLDGPFDFVFMDADKTQYLDYFEALLPKLGRHAMIAADNTLWNGDVMDESIVDIEVKKLREFNAAVSADPRVTSVLLTIRDGITLIWPNSSTTR